MTLFLLFNYLRKIQTKIKASAIADDVLYLQSHYIPGRSEGDSMEPLFVPLLTGMKVSSSDGEGSGKHLYLKSTLSTVAPSERGERPWGDWRGGGWFSAYTLTRKEALRHSLLFQPWVWNSLWWLFYQRSCPSPGRPEPKEDDPHFLKAKCSVLISRNEQPVTRVNLLNPGRFIVSCHSWTHRADL